jgi:hypothetical protein
MNFIVWKFFYFLLTLNIGISLGGEFLMINPKELSNLPTI